MNGFHQRVEDYERDGYAIFKSYLAPDKVSDLRHMLDGEFERRHAEHLQLPRATISNILAHETLAPVLAGHILNADLLDFAEAVMGPYLQLDSLEISGYPSVGLEQKGKVAGWHRDAFNQTEQWADYPIFYQLGPRPYAPPMAGNCLTYLQDMADESGPLRIIPGSHLTYTFIGKEAQHDPHPQERFVSLEAGDMVFTHCDLLHSGTLNTSGAIRYFISGYCSRIGLPHCDTFETPTIDRIVNDARRRNDRRVLRLFGIDEGFHQRQRASWKQMTDDDRQALVP